MYNLLISLAAAVAVFIPLKFALDLHWLMSLFIAMLVFVGVFYLISRIVMKKITEVMETVTKDLQGQRVEKGIRELQKAFKYGKWQIYVTGQLNAQIGMIYYMKRDFAAAFPYLEKAFFKNWPAMGMLAITYMKRSKPEKMKETFEKALQGSPKESLLWNLYAYCLVEIGDIGKAKDVLEKGLKKMPGEERLQHNLEALREGKRMKMKNYGEMWLQFHLEKPSAVMKQQAAAMGGMKRRIIRR
ncbi:tetratricopeptide repeat protein [Geobacter sp. DSM 9736]|uniref:tetratricopeptide repeat protein n=1 Tax=Geobacter sp. DSM 9736 TaxID=1277350 RepID=UPI000B50844A|nr:tetratricopeptide repeat protein [Geobacter sp. DSM 9736]SNB46698.1 Tetratricopeptide repeat-containing protein [Geobacter sp. DSM 9736]